MSISVFANIKVDDIIRFERLKLSFESFKDYNFENWVINIRGLYRVKVSEYLKKNLLREKLEISTQENTDNWFLDTQKLFPKIKGDFIFLWNEDHINITDQNNFNNIIQDIIDNKVDQFRYTWFHDGLDVKSAQLAGFSIGDRILFDNYTFKKHAKRIKLCKKLDLKSDIFIVSMTSIFKKTLFKKILFTDDPLIKRWNKNTPFDFEKCSYDIHWLPFKLAYPKKEFFASIDDNHGQKKYSLIERGLIDKNLGDKKIKKLKSRNITFKNLLFYPFRILKIFLRELINYMYARIIYLGKKND